MSAMGAEINIEDGNIKAKVDGRLKGAKILFEPVSVTGTENVIMAATLAEGITVIENAAREPEIIQLCDYINKMGGSVQGIGTSRIIVDGVKELNAADIQVIPDRIEAGTFLIAGAVLGEVTLVDINPSHLESIVLKLKDAGCDIKIHSNSITINSSDNLKSVDMTTAVYPGFATDLQAQWVALMSLAKGSTVITDTVYHDRFSHVPELNRFGADIKVDKNTALVRGVDELIGAPVMSTDIRASASLIIAGLAAKGLTTISRVYHIDRGYENIESKFRQLGADIKRIKVS